MSELRRILDRSARMPRRPLSLRQRGMIAVFAIVFLLVVVIFALSQTLNISASNIGDTKQQSDSVAALFLAESGLESIMRPLTVAAQAGALTHTVCTGLAGGPFTLGSGGSFSIPVPASNPNPCGGSDPVCTSCSVKVVGTVGSASRTVNLNIALAPQNGVTGFGGTVASTPPGITLTATNTEPFPAAMAFQLAWRRQGSAGQSPPGGQSKATECSGCGVYWNIESSAGSPSVGSIGVSNTLAPGETKTVQQTLNLERNYAEVGALFVSATSAAIGQSGAYWNGEGGAGGGNTTTGATGVNSGKTNNGTFSSSGTLSNPETDAKQTATHWCWGADTLVAGFSGRSSSTDTLSSFTFGPSLKPLTVVAALSHPAADIYSEIWYAFNPYYYSSATGNTPDDRASSYPRMVKGSIGASFTATIPNNSDQMTVSAVASGRLWPGDVIIGGTPRLPAGTTVTATSFPAGGLTGIYTLSAGATGSGPPISNRNLLTASTTLTVTAVTRDLAAGATNVSGVTITSGPDGSGNYQISNPPTTVVPITAITQGASGSTINVPSGSPLPMPGTMVAVQHGIGAIAPGTTVTGVGTDSFTISAAPNPPLTGATVCGGICALFNHDPAVNGGMTDFAIQKGAGTSQWAAGFSCLSGVSSSTPPRPITSLKVQPTAWSESF